ncbi:MAG: AMIN domain-containing protein [Terriglobales bacterium]
MSRFSYFAVFLSIALLAGPLAAQKGATVEHVVVRGAPDALEVEIQTSGAPVSPNTQAVTGPDRIVIDFPGAHPSPELRGLTVNRGALKTVRSGLFFNNPPITRIVLDLADAQSYHITTNGNSVLVKLGAATSAARKVAPPAIAGPPKVGTAQLRETAMIEGLGTAPARKPSPAIGSFATISIVREPITRAPAAKEVFPVEVVPSAGVVQHEAGSASMSPASMSSAPVSPASVRIDSPVIARAMAPASDGALNASPAGVNTGAAVPGMPNSAEMHAADPKPLSFVSYVNGMLSIQSEGATLAQLLFEVQKKTQAEIAIPAGAEQEQVFIKLGPGPARDVLGTLLNGSPYNFIFVGNELSLERVILTRRDPSIF